MSYEVLARKYRPTNFEEVIGQEHITKALINSIDSNKIHQAYILSGTRGIGKTTIARVLAKCLNCKSSDNPVSNPCNNCVNCEETRLGRSLDFYERDAASERGIDAMKDLLQTVPLSPSSGRFKIYLLDEAHQITTEASNALLKILEEPPKHVIFILATTNPEKILKTVQSRCLQLNLKTVNEDVLSQHLQKILKFEKIKFDLESIKLISKSAKGSVRDALTLLDQAIAYGNGELKQEDIKNLIGTIDDSLLIDLIYAVVDGDGKKVFNTLSKIEQLSPEYDSILKDIIATLHQIALEQVLKNSDMDHIKEMAIKIDDEFCQLLYEIAMNSYSKFKVHPSPKEALEICLLRMLTFNPLHKLSENPLNKSLEEKKNLKEDKKKEEKTDKTKSELSDVLSFSKKDWINFFNKTTKIMSPFTRNYFGNMSFKDFSNDVMTLIVNSESVEVPKNILLEFKSILKEFFSKEIEVNFEVGTVIDSPLAVKDAENIKKYNEAKSSIKDDKDIQTFMNKFNGIIKEDTIKPIK